MWGGRAWKPRAEAREGRPGRGADAQRIGTRLKLSMTKQWFVPPLRRGESAEISDVIRALKEKGSRHDVGARPVRMLSPVWGLIAAGSLLDRRGSDSEHTGSVCAAGA